MCFFIQTPFLSLFSFFLFCPIACSFSPRSFSVVAEYFLGLLEPFLSFFTYTWYLWSFSTFFLFQDAFLPFMNHLLLFFFSTRRFWFFFWFFFLTEFFENLLHFSRILFNSSFSSNKRLSFFWSCFWSSKQDYFFIPLANTVFQAFLEYFFLFPELFFVFVFLKSSIFVLGVDISKVVETVEVLVMEKRLIL